MRNNGGEIKKLKKWRELRLKFLEFLYYLFVEFLIRECVFSFFVVVIKVGIELRNFLYTDRYMCA